MLTNIILGKGYFGVVFMGEDKEKKSCSSFHSSHCNQGELTNGNKDAVKLIKSDFKMEQHVLVMYMIGLLIENAGVCLNSLTLGLLCIQ
jgi:hypothetical protein